MDPLIRLRHLSYENEARRMSRSTTQIIEVIAPSSPMPDLGPETEARARALDGYVRLVNCWLAGVMAVTVMATAAGMCLARIGVRLNLALVVHAWFLAMLFLGCWYFARRGDRKGYHLMLIAFWIVLTTNIHLLPMFLAGRADVDPADATLARWDRALGLEVTDIIGLTRQYPAIDHMLGHVYQSLMLLITAAVILAPMTGRVVAAMETIVACVLSVYLAFPAFALLQARGPWRYYGYSPLIDQRGFESKFAALKGDVWFFVDLNYKDGIVCFPSYHTILAVLAAAALSGVPYLGRIATSWAALIVVSTLTTGSHYVVDVLAGLAVAAVSVAGARGVSRLAWERIGVKEGRGRIDLKSPRLAAASDSA